MGQIKDNKIKDFLEEVASSAPTPGGGAVAAVTGASAAALVEMVINLTNKQSLPLRGNLELRTKNLTRAKTLRQKLLELADEDASAFGAVMTAFKLSKENPERKDEIQKAFKGAAETPLRIAKLSKEVNRLAKEILKVGNKNAASDAKTAIFLSEAATKSAIANVEINLGYIKDQKFVAVMKEEVAELV